MCYICTVPINTGAGSLKSWKAINFWLGRTIGTVLSTYYAVGKARLIRYDTGSIPVLSTYRGVEQVVARQTHNL
jgi:hypothetical protein